MIKHLIYNIPRGYKVGYGALFTKIFKDFDIDMSKDPIILPRVENILGMATMKLLKLDVVTYTNEFLLYHNAILDVIQGIYWSCPPGSLGIASIREKSSICHHKYTKVIVG